MTSIIVSVQKVFLPFIHHSQSKGFSARITGTASDVVKQRKKNITKTLRKHILIHLVARGVKNFADKHSQATKTLVTVKITHYSITMLLLYKINNINMKTYNTFTE